MKATTIMTRKLEIQDMELYYELFKQNRDDYGVSITKIMGETAVSETLVDITTSRRKAVDLYGRIVDGVVTPATLRDVVYDLLCD